jgi:hypothetical protein
MIRRDESRLKEPSGNRKLFQSGAVNRYSPAGYNATTSIPFNKRHHDFVSQTGT